ncbi:MAG: hypothetical protein PHT41_05115 [Candidatus Omnitrophica bacterium]|nr:hypothetical protein [Candidatus Omnitrophota bacterium]MDD5238314.1 hypothetical protein [Candidatus Omnitrophota bacterium]
MKTKREGNKAKKKLALKFFVEPRLIKRGSLKEVTFDSTGQG